MDNIMRGAFPAMLVLMLAVYAGPGLTQSKSQPGKIVCWKDSSGKTVGCGDTVPPEYQTSATKELNKQGVTRKTTESAAEQAAKTPGTDPARNKEQKEEEQRKLSEQKRQDNALINTFSNEKEIDAKRDRELQALELQLGQLKVSLKNATDRQAEITSRSDALEKSKKPVPDNLKAEKTQNVEETAKLQQRVAAKEKEMEEMRVRYAEFRKRYSELKGTAQPAAAAPAGGSAPRK